MEKVLTIVLVNDSSDNLNAPKKPLAVDANNHPKSFALTNIITIYIY